MEDIDWGSVVNLLKSGKTYKEVATLYDINVNTLISWCKKRNIYKRCIEERHFTTHVKQAVLQVRNLSENI